jgi:pyruvate/2-oxoglutarate dehydrogenase complex dihydrolipoamide acyltransferase (E2) component
MELVRFPKAAENITEGTVSRWLVAPGARVERDQPLVELITEKAEFELPSPAAGRVAGIFAPERSTVPVNYVLCALAEPDEALPDVEAINAELAARHQAELLGTAAPAPAVSPPHSPPTTRHPQPATGGKIAASPAARRLAREQGVDLAAVAARLKLSRTVSEDDVRKFLADKGL